MPLRERGCDCALLGGELDEVRILEEGLVGEDLFRAAPGDESVILAEQVDAVCHLAGEGQVMSGQDDCFAGLLELMDELAQPGATARIEAGGGLIHQPDVRAQGEDRGQCHLLLLAARKLMRGTLA
ncbi:hypothetical protein SDC9_200990 [bioreactor metagenome]|uniref:Uncharacterized protein n=1 Tax=bioreactor metagenome TaxID=1076179 RepID=A0A645IQF3_9ZZZZ